MSTYISINLPELNSHEETKPWKPKTRCLHDVTIFPYQFNAVYTEVATLGHFRNPSHACPVAKVFRLFIRFSTRAAWACAGCRLCLFCMEIERCGIWYGFKLLLKMKEFGTTSNIFVASYFKVQNFEAWPPFKVLTTKKCEMIIRCHIHRRSNLSMTGELRTSVGVCRERCHLRIHI